MKTSDPYERKYPGTCDISLSELADAREEQKAADLAAESQMVIITD